MFGAVSCVIPICITCMRCFNRVDMLGVLNSFQVEFSAPILVVYLLFDTL